MLDDLTLLLELDEHEKMSLPGFFKTGLAASVESEDFKLSEYNFNHMGLRFIRVLLTHSIICKPPKLHGLIPENVHPPDLSYKSIIPTLVSQNFSILNHRALYNHRNFLLCVIPPPILGAFYNNEKNILFIDIEQAISQ